MSYFFSFYYATSVVGILHSSFVETLDLASPYINNSLRLTPKKKAIQITSLIFVSVFICTGSVVGCILYGSIKCRDRKACSTNCADDRDPGKDNHGEHSPGNVDRSTLFNHLTVGNGYVLHGSRVIRDCRLVSENGSLCNSRHNLVTTKLVSAHNDVLSTHRLSTEVYRTS